MPFSPACSARWPNVLTLVQVHWKRSLIFAQSAFKSESYSVMSIGIFFLGEEGWRIFFLRRYRKSFLQWQSKSLCLFVIIDDIHLPYREVRPFHFYPFFGETRKRSKGDQRASCLFSLPGRKYGVSYTHSKRSLPCMITPSLGFSQEYFWLILSQGFFSAHFMPSPFQGREDDRYVIKSQGQK